MLFEGNPEVLVRLFLKKQLFAKGDSRHEEIRPALLILSGVMCGIYSGGQVSALERFNLNDVFDLVAGISTGAPTAAYFLAKQAVIGTTIYSEECTTPDFLSLSHLRQGNRPIMDTDYLMKVFRGMTSNKKINQEAIQQSRSRFYVGVTSTETGRGEFIDAKSVKPDIVEAVHASLVMPGISRGSIMLGGKQWTDGSVSLIFPVQKFLSEFEPTDILILTNRDENHQQRVLLERPLLSLLFTKSKLQFLKAYRQHKKQFVDEVNFLHTHRKVRSAILWTNKEIGIFERNPQKLKLAAQTAETHLSRLLVEAQKTAMTLTT